MSKLLANIERVSAGYNGETVLRNISLKIHDHDFIGVIGPNGGGKTTMVKVLLGLLTPYKGKVSQPSGPIRIGYLPQAAQIDRSFPITVQEVVESGLQGRPFWRDRKSTRLNSSHARTSYAVFCLKKKKKNRKN